MYVARGLFYGVGTRTVGALLDRVGQHTNRLLGAWQVTMALCGALFPYAWSVWTLVLLVSAMNFAGGCVDVMGNVLLVQVWHSLHATTTSARDAARHRRRSLTSRGLQRAIAGMAR